MRVFHSLVFDENLESTATSIVQDIDASWNAQLGLPDKLTIFAVTDTVSGASPTLTVQIQESPDQVHWLNKSTAAELTGTLSTSANQVLVGRDPGTTPSAAFVRLRITLGVSSGTGKGHVRIWVTGRGEQIPMGQ